MVGHHDVARREQRRRIGGLDERDAAWLLNSCEPGAPVDSTAEFFVRRVERTIVELHDDVQAGADEARHDLLARQMERGGRRPRRRVDRRAPMRIEAQASANRGGVIGTVDERIDFRAPDEDGRLRLHDP